MTETTKKPRLQVGVAVTPDQHALLQKAGELSGVTPATKMREIGLTWSREVVKEVAG
ncbi:hypothetical protein [Tateyamaria sp.]|uniref:hypothetical protein n=1 Tax=Tateyamaria sp. TaxID=1929288 RepID=UPI00329AA71D